MDTTMLGYLMSIARDTLPWEQDGASTTLPALLTQDAVRAAPVLLLSRRRPTGALTLLAFRDTTSAIRAARGALFGEHAAPCVLVRDDKGTLRVFTLAWTVALTSLPDDDGRPTPTQRTRVLRRAVERTGAVFEADWDRQVEWRETIVPVDALEAGDARYALLGWSPEDAAVTVDLLKDLAELPAAIADNLWGPHAWFGLWDLTRDRAVDPDLIGTLTPVAATA